MRRKCPNARSREIISGQCLVGSRDDPLADQSVEFLSAEIGAYLFVTLKLDDITLGRYVESISWVYLPRGLAILYIACNLLT